MLANAWIRSGSRHWSNNENASAPTINTSSASGFASRSVASVSTVKDNPARSISMESAAKPGTRDTSRSVIAIRWSGPALTRPILNGCVAAGTNRTASRPSDSAASSTGSRCPTCGGSKLPPKIPRRTPQGVGSTIGEGGPVDEGGAVAGVEATGEEGAATPVHATRVSASSGKLFRSAAQASTASSR